MTTEPLERTGRRAVCPVCDLLVDVVRKPGDPVDLFAEHTVPGYSHHCCESLDPVPRRAYRVHPG